MTLQIVMRMLKSRRLSKVRSGNVRCGRCEIQFRRARRFLPPLNNEMSFSDGREVTDVILRARNTHCGRRRSRRTWRRKPDEIGLNICMRRSKRGVSRCTVAQPNHVPAPFGAADLPFV